MRIWGDPAWLACALLVSVGCGRSPLSGFAGGENPPPTSGDPSPNATPLHPLLVPPGPPVVLNECYPVEAAFDDQVLLGDDAAANPSIPSGRLLLLHQTQDGSGMDAIGGPTVTMTDGAGTWELVRVETVSSHDVQLTAMVTTPYETSTELVAQACVVPEYSDVTVQDGGSIVAAPWEGDTGGILAFVATGTLRVDGALDASWAGFRGGEVGPNANQQDLTANIVGWGPGGGKGESLNRGAWFMAGRANIAQGGGGGNGFNAGGGGGGNGGAGGLGGTQASSRGANSETNGFGGAQIVMPGAFTFGGGGGAGQQDDGQAGGGGAGGGLIFLSADVLTGHGTIIADGRDGFDSISGNEADGAGGGGAGGTIHITTATGTTFTGDVRAAGGNGGSVNDTNPQTIRYGPGGGGGGGRIDLVGFTLTSATVPGGAAGECVDESDPYQAENGNAGIRTP